MKTQCIVWKILFLTAAGAAVFCACQWWWARSQEYVAMFALHDMENTHDLLTQELEGSPVSANYMGYWLTYMVETRDEKLSKLRRSPLHVTIEKHYEKTMQEVIVFLEANTGEDHGSDPRAWCRRYEELGSGWKTSNKPSETTP